MCRIGSVRTYYIGRATWPRCLLAARERERLAESGLFKEKMYGNLESHPVRCSSHILVGLTALGKACPLFSGRHVCLRHEPAVFQPHLHEYSTCHETPTRLLLRFDTIVTNSRLLFRRRSLEMCPTDPGLFSTSLIIRESEPNVSLLPARFRPSTRTDRTSPSTST